MTKYELNQLDVRNDGRIILYQRPRKDGSVIPTWQMRISVPNSTGYKRASTGEKEQSEAIRKAINTYEKLYMKVLGGGSLQSKSYKSVYAEWKVYLPRMVGNERKEYVDGQLRYAGLYPLRFFGERKIDDISKGDFVEYWMWRNENSERLQPMTGETTPYIPSPNTLRREADGIRNMFKYAIDKGWMTSLPDMAKPSYHKNRRPSFTNQEWRLLVRRMREWVKEGQKWGGVGRGRFVSQQYVLILANCGARVGELRYLRWGDLTTQSDDDSKRLVAFVKGKTGEREIVFQQGSEEYIKRLYDLRKDELGHHPSPDDLVFCNSKGQHIQSFRKGFETLLNYCKLTYDTQGNRRSLYSLRHFYATQRLSEEVSPFLLARQMGTSIEMLERFYGHVVTSLVAKEVTKTKGIRKQTPQTGETDYPFEVTG
jgi:site-specific recombinase XerD